MMFTTVHQIMTIQVPTMLEKAYHHHRRRLFRPSTPRSSLYVGDLQPHTIDDDLHQLFSMIGSVTSVRVYTDRP
ncbi:putative RNA recognition motif domain, nucleotide-binding alpha-beta plait domain superfamily [Helianthus anomalus]